MFSNTLLYYLVVINIATFIAYGLDKLKAKHHWWRIPEKWLLLLAVAGGSVGAILGIKFWHHKTNHKKFKYGVPAIAVAQIVIYFLFSPCL